MSRRALRYDLHLNTPATGVMHVATAGLEEVDGVLSRFETRYTEAYLAHSAAIDLDPIHLPLQPGNITLRCKGRGQPGVLDDYLPDAWGRKVLAQYAFYTQGLRITEHSPIDQLTFLGDSHIGALEWVAQGGNPGFALGAPMADLLHAERIATAVHEGSAPANTDAISLLLLANAGSGAGGARPKALVHSDDGAYLAKFNSRSMDRYNNARVELACMHMAAAGGIRIANGRVAPGINEREVLLIERFDVVGEHRHHLITANALLKDPATQQDRGGAFRYDDVADLIRRFSAKPAEDLEQLLRLMLFNAAIHNTDDHERNFSFMYSGTDLRLAPAYDLVPSLTTGEYHAAGFTHAPSPPLPGQVEGRAFGLSKTQVSDAVEAVSAAVRDWEAFAEAAGVTEEELKLIERFMRVG
jgi:serine/threonine-protein kinase HipA